MEEKEAAAETRWLRDLRNFGIIRRGSGAETQLGVVGVPRTEFFCCVLESRREATCSDTIHSKCVFVCRLSPSMA